jgi:membrane protease YdiL (CAAX protease family)
VPEDKLSLTAHISSPLFGHGSDLAGAEKLPGVAHWGFWGTLIWGAVIGAIFVALQTILVIAAVGYRYGSHVTRLDVEGLARDGGFLALSTLVTTIGCSGAVVGIIKMKKGAVIAEYLGLKKIALRDILRWVGFFAIFMIVSGLLATFLRRPESSFMADAYSTSDPLGLFWFAVVVAAPLSEEIFFRGFLFRGLEASFLRPVGTIFVTAGLWAALHVQYDAYDIASIFAMGLLFGAARRDTGSLLLPIGLHMFVNLLATTEAAVLR